MTGNGASSVVGHSNGAVPDDIPNAPTSGTTGEPVAPPSPVRRTKRQQMRHDRDDLSGKTIARIGFGCGAILSVLANWLFTWMPGDTRPPGWHPGVAPQIGSAVWPVVLMLSVEVLLRVRWRPGMWWKTARYGGAGTVAVGSAVISYGHVYHVLMSWGYDSIGAHVGPLAIDGFMVICGFAMLSESTRGQEPPIADLGGNVHARKTFERSDALGDSGDIASDTSDTRADRDATRGDTVPDIDRDSRIRAMHRAGMSTREIGRDIGLHHSTVARIVAPRDGSDSASDTRDGLHLVPGGPASPDARDPQ